MMLPLTDLQIREAVHADAPALVLLHVFGGSRREWIEAGVMLAPQFRIVSMDTPGFGEADQITGYTVAEMADRFAETIQALKLERFVLVGHSMTGKVAAVLAGRGLPGLEKVVLLTPSPLSPEPIAPKDRATMLAQAEPTKADAEEYIRSNSSLRIRPEIFERAVEDRLRTSPDAWRAWLEHGSYEDWTEQVPRLSQPTLVIAAEEDKSLGPAVQRQLTMPRLLNGQLAVVPKSGHMVPLEAPKQLADLIREFTKG